MITPKVTHCTEDEFWGKPGYPKKIYTEKTLIQKAGLFSTDTVVERIENKYWKIEVADFQHWILGFSKFTGEWQTTELAANKIQIDYTYSLHSKHLLLYPLHWIFTKTYWRIYMYRVLRNIKKMIENNEPYLYD